MGKTGEVCRSLVVAAALAGSAFAVPGVAEAGVIAEGTITLVRDKGTTGYSGDNGGGEMGVSVFTGTSVVAMGSSAQVSGSYFQTFCIERNEYFTPGTNYNYVINDAATSGGVSGGNPDPISAATAWLYTKFYFGNLDGYDYDLGTDRKNSATQLQNAFWYLENELTSLDTTSQAYAWVQAAREATDNDGYLDDWAGGIGGVRVLNITDSAGTMKQDQLFMVAVPLPPAAFLGLGGLVGLGALRASRRRRKSS